MGGGDDDDDVYLVEWVVGWRFGGEGVPKFWSLKDGDGGRVGGGVV